jgi:hypothetical protein
MGTNKKKTREAKRKAAFASSRAEAKAAKPVKYGLNGPPIVRWEKRKWTPFVDVTDLSTSAWMRKLGVSKEDAIKVVTGGKGGRCYQNSLYFVVVSKMGVMTRRGVATGYCLSIRSEDREARHDWRHFQRIKNELCGPEYEAVEIYPAESRLVDTANQYYLWVLPEGERMTFGFDERLVVEDTGASGARQRPWDPDCRPSDLKVVDEKDDESYVRSLLRDTPNIEVTFERDDEEEDSQREGDRGDVDRPPDEQRHLPGDGGGPDGGGREPRERGEGREGEGLHRQAGGEVPGPDGQDRREVQQPPAAEEDEQPPRQEGPG